MAADTQFVLIAVVTFFGLFVAGLAYAQWSTRGMAMPTARDAS